jgi:hypothetical protein
LSYLPLTLTSPPSLPPLRCYCGTKSCRGYLEVLDDDDDNDDEMNSSHTPVEKTGLSVPHTEAYREALRSGQGGEWLINKRVKIWWDGNQRYFDADVLSYDPSHGIHTIQYLEDGQVSKEILGLNRYHVQRKYSPWLEMNEENVLGCVEKETTDIVTRRRTDSDVGIESKGRGGESETGGGGGGGGIGGGENNLNKKRKINESQASSPLPLGNGVNSSTSTGSSVTEITEPSTEIEVIIKPVCDWLWLDESRKDVTIRKKTTSDSIDTLQENEDHHPNGHSSSQNHPSSGSLETNFHTQPILTSSFSRPALSPLIKVSTKISAEICHHILMSLSNEGIIPFSVGETDLRGIVKVFSDVMKVKYETFIRQQLQEFDSGQEMPVSPLSLSVSLSPSLSLSRHNISCSFSSPTRPVRSCCMEE